MSITGSIRCSVKILLVAISLAVWPNLTKAHIYQWEYIDPNNPSLGTQPSSSLAPEGAGLTAEPGLYAFKRDLTKGYLSGFDLTDAYFEQATFTDADLSESNFTGARFFASNFTSARLVGSNFTNADLFRTKLTGANLTGAIITDAHFKRTTDSGFTSAQLYSTASYQLGELSGIDISYNNLAGWDFSGQNLTNASFYLSSLSGADLTDAIVVGANFDSATANGFTVAQLYSTASYQLGDLSGIDISYNNLAGGDFAGKNLTDSSFDHSIIADADFAGAIVIGASFDSTSTRGLTATQLYSTTSYQLGDLSGIGLRDNDLAGWGFSGQNLTNADLKGANLTGANLAGSIITGADFGSTTYSGLTAEQFYSTASYQLGDLSGIGLSGNNLSGWDFSGRRITNASFFVAGLTGANLTGADSRGSGTLNYDSATTHNLIHPDGHVEGLHITAGETLRLWDYHDGDPVAVVVEQGFSVDPNGVLRIVLEDDLWGSTLHFVSDIPVSLDGTLELLLDDDANPTSLVGTTFQLFDWAGVTPTGAFDTITFQPGTMWDTSQLYTSGEVTLVQTRLEGDYNNDGLVDIADYTVWRNRLGATGLEPWSPGDGNGDGMVDAGDYTVWVSNFGRSASSASTISTDSNVPEPSTALLIAVVGGLCLVRRATICP